MAAFMATVSGQMAKVFACRSSTRPPWQLGWRTNHLLFPAVALAGLVSGLALSVAPVARTFDQALPSLVGWLIAVATAPVVLVVGATAKRLTQRAPRAAS